LQHAPPSPPEISRHHTLARHHTLMRFYPWQAVPHAGSHAGACAGQTRRRRQRSPRLGLARAGAAARGGSLTRRHRRAWRRRHIERRTFTFALVVQRLCAAGREQGAELLRRARAARLALHSDARPASFTVETRRRGRAWRRRAAPARPSPRAAAARRALRSDAARSGMGARCARRPDAGPGGQVCGRSPARGNALLRTIKAVLQLADCRTSRLRAEHACWTRK